MVWSIVMKTLTVKQHTKEIVLSLIASFNCPGANKSYQNGGPVTVSQTEEGVTISETLSSYLVPKSTRTYFLSTRTYFGQLIVVPDLWSFRFYPSQLVPILVNLYLL